MTKPKLKFSVSRKSLRKMSTRQQNRVMFEIRQNLRLHNSKFNIIIRESDNEDNTQSTSNKSIAGCSDVINNSIDDVCVTEHDTNVDNESSAASSSSSLSLADIDNSFIKSSFRERLATCFVDNNVTHTQSNNILSLLRTHPCFSNLPKDVRTLLHTPQNRIILTSVEPGQYIHFDLEAAIVENLSNLSFVPVVEQLELDFNTDGCYLDKSGNTHI